MSNHSLPAPAERPLPALWRLLIGTPLLCIILSLLSGIEWAIQGFAPDLSPRHWLDDCGALFLAMSFGGGVAALLAAGLLLTLGLIALVIGEGCLRAVRRKLG